MLIPNKKKYLYDLFGNFELEQNVYLSLVTNDWFSKQIAEIRAY